MPNHHVKYVTAAINITRGTKIEATLSTNRSTGALVAWARTAEIVNQYANKGKQLFIEGRLQPRQGEDRDGNTRYTTEVVADNIQLLGRAGGGGGNGSGDYGDPGPSGPDGGSASDDGRATSAG